MSGFGKKDKGSAKCGVKVPETTDFQCPGGDCGCMKKEPKKDKNNNDECVEPENQDGKCKCDEKKGGNKAEIRKMPKVDCAACKPKEEEGKCSDGKNNNKNAPAKNIEDDPPKACGQLPETKTFKCIDESMVPERKDEETKKDCASPSSCNSCGAAVVGPKCDCGKPLPPVPPRTCGCKNQGGPCCANTSCEVIPLSTMVTENTETDIDIID